MKGNDQLKNWFHKQIEYGQEKVTSHILKQVHHEKQGKTMFLHRKSCKPVGTTLFLLLS